MHSTHLFVSFDCIYFERIDCGKILWLGVSGGAWVIKWYILKIVKNDKLTDRISGKNETKIVSHGAVELIAAFSFRLSCHLMWRKSIFFF